MSRIMIHVLHIKHPTSFKKIMAEIDRYCSANKLGIPVKEEASADLTAVTLVFNNSN